MIQPENPKLIVLVAVHKPCILPKENIFIPIHCGRAISKLDSISLEWMKANTIGDDTGENISHLNEYFCELTAVYWAWKNYEQLGNPERIGLCHYRRFFMDVGDAYEMTVPSHYLNKTIREQFNRHHDPIELTRALNLLKQDLKNDIEMYLNQSKGYFFNMFILPKQIFFEYCEILFDVLFKLLETASWKKLDTYQRRMAGFISERLTGGIIYHLHKTKQIPIHETLTIIPLSTPLIKYQTDLTAYLANHFSNFPKVYSLFLSTQTHALKYFVKS